MVCVPRARDRFDRRSVITETTVLTVLNIKITEPLTMPSLGEDDGADRLIKVVGIRTTQRQ